MRQLLTEMETVLKFMIVMMEILSKRLNNQSVEENGTCGIDVAAFDDGTLKVQNVKERLPAYADCMKQEELSTRTITKYLTDIRGWISRMPETFTKKEISEYKGWLMKTYRPASVRSKIIAVNRYLKWLGYSNLTVKLPKMQKTENVDRVLSRREYEVMTRYAKENGKKKLYYILKTIAATGIRVRELQFITAEAVKQGSVVVFNKGKSRRIYLPESLCGSLKVYCQENGIESGVLFSGNQKGKAITPNAVWKNMKELAKKAGVDSDRAFPHSLRHLFAKEYIRRVGDLSELASILGHSRMEITRIYTQTTTEEKRVRLDSLGL